MLNNEWKQVAGFTNMGDDEENIFAKKVDDVVSVAYSAYGGLKVVELTGVDEEGTFANMEADYSTVISECGDDWEIAIPVVCGGETTIVVIDDTSDTAVIPFGEGVENVPSPVVASAEEYDADECQELDEDLLRAFHLV
jgi:hypothetical protein